MTATLLKLFEPQNFRFCIMCWIMTHIQMNYCLIYCYSLLFYPSTLLLLLQWCSGSHLVCMSWSWWICLRINAVYKLPSPFINMTQWQIFLYCTFLLRWISMRFLPLLHNKGIKECCCSFFKFRHFCTTTALSYSFPACWGHMSVTPQLNLVYHSLLPRKSHSVSKFNTL